MHALLLHVTTKTAPQKKINTHTRHTDTQTVCFVSRNKNMLHIKSESDITSLAPSSPSRSPKRAVYFVQSPSRDSDQDGDKSGSMQATPHFRSPMESPLHPSHSRNSSSTRFSGMFRSHSGRKVQRKMIRNDKGWPECNVIVEEGKYEEFDGEKRVARRVQALMAFFGFVVLFTILCLIIWGAARPYKAEITVKSLVVNSLYIGQGSDSSGVITKLLTINGSLHLGVRNPATFFGIRVSSTPVNLVYSEIVIATGQLKKYYQPRNSRRMTIVNIEATKVPLYGAGSTLVVSDTGVFEIPLRLEFEIRSKGEVVGKLVTTKHRRQISCNMTLPSNTIKSIRFGKSSCIYK